MEGGEDQPRGLERTPGPNKYMLRPLLGQINHDLTKPQQPAFTILGRHNSERVEEKPAPNKYQTTNLTRYGHVTSGKLDPSLGGKYTQSRVKFTPGPDKYDVTAPTKVTKLSQAPAYSLGARIKHDPPNLKFPGPEYKLTTYIDGTGYVLTGKSSPAYPMLGRLPTKEFDVNIPGPQKYGVTPLEITKAKIPQWTMLARPSRPQKFDSIPGPKYNTLINPIGKSGPAFTMSSRYRPLVRTMRTKEDDAPRLLIPELG